MVWRQHHCGLWVAEGAGCARPPRRRARTRTAPRGRGGRGGRAGDASTATHPRRDSRTACAEATTASQSALLGRRFPWRRKSRAAAGTASRCWWTPLGAAGRPSLRCCPGFFRLVFRAAEAR
jgi:hypothetical protein